MKFLKLRLVGFKSFVDPSEFLIEPGLTGVVGPNGCGKSNLVEALRWVMGESSYKAMRASGMDDVIFSGSLNRPSRNTAEVALTLDNGDRTAPPAFNDADHIEVARRIEREAGSNYRVNGREVRARDVQLLFADASTGARSPSMVRQGQIGELIAAKPQARRAILEEAAGISGLHSRRHEAELRLKAAEQNLDRLEDVLAEIEQQLESLKRQARQATRYRNLSGDIRRTEAALYHLRWTQSRRLAEEADQALGAARRLVAEKAEHQATTAKDQAVAAHQLPALRDEAAKAGAALQRLMLARGELDAAEVRARERLADLDRRLGQLAADIEREKRMVGENSGFLDRLAAEAATLQGETNAAAERETEAATRLAAAGEVVAKSEAAFAEATAKAAEAAARRNHLERAARETAERQVRLERQLADADRDLAAIAALIADLPDIAANRAAVEGAADQLAKAEADVAAAEAAVEAAREAEAAARAPLGAAESALYRHEAEVKTLTEFLASGSGRKFPPVVDALSVAPGYEAAIGAAFGEDLEASLDPRAPAHWVWTPVKPDEPGLPDGAAALADHVNCPPELARRLKQTGLVEASEGATLQARLAVGQQLVSKAGDLWRWDGFSATAEAPTAATQRLAQKNRLDEVKKAADQSRAEVATLKAALGRCQGELEAALAAERAGRDTVRGAQRALSEAKDRYARADRRRNEAEIRRAGLEETRGRVAAGVEEARLGATEAAAALAGAEDLGALQAALAELRQTVAADRAKLADARAGAEGLKREADLRQKRLAAIAAERATWQTRIANAEGHIKTLAERRDEAAAERAGLADTPAEIENRRLALSAEVDKAEAIRKQAADRLAEAETRLATADRAARDALAALSEAREGQARAEERVNAAGERRREIERRIEEALEVAPADTAALAGLKPGGELPDAEAVEGKLERLRQERERLGGVNLRAEDEAREIADRRDAMIRERDDLIEAIRRLRSAIHSLNREGRERLLAAFETVNGHFQELFQKLFGGGTAELQLTESDDPLDAGLEIVAKPPGKKPQTLTLLSGGEQALTALALIFAVFLTNPAPICVLDEVDAPLDDANVERFCDLVDEMTKLTETRFVVITHNPITMARMDRLFGVTMSERGVSQLVSVDLETAEKYREAG